MGFLRCVEGCKTDFFLTGGTALSRAYYSHRYSDDLDFFVCSDENFKREVELILAALAERKFQWREDEDFVRSGDFYTLAVSRDDYPEISLKLDFANDVARRYGELTRSPIFHRTDSVRNILSNKLTALFRFEAKDVADIREICRNYKFSWASIVEEARTKEAGVEAPLAAEILLGIPESDFLSMRWSKQPAWEDFRADLSVIAADLTRGNENSLCS